MKEEPNGALDGVETMLTGLHSIMNDQFIESRRTTSRCPPNLRRSAGGARAEPMAMKVMNEREGSASWSLLSIKKDGRPGSVEVGKA